MTKAQRAAITSLREAGYAVTVMSPDDLQGVRPRDIENVMVREANEAVDDLKTYPEHHAA